jgi:conjugal transfer pilus assembly protein TraW
MSFSERIHRVQLGIVLVSIAVTFGTTVASAIDLGNHGPTYPITEQDFLEQITSIAKQKVASGEWAQLEKDTQKGFLNRLQDMPPVATFAVASATRSWLFDPTVELRGPISDQNGRVIHAAGTRVNPLDVVPLSEPFMFIDGRDERQVNLARRLHQEASGNLKIILVAGNYLKLATDWSTPIYFDQQALMTGKLGIRVLPALVTQLGRNLKVEEIKP